MANEVQTTVQEDEIDLLDLIGAYGCGNNSA